MINFGCLSAGGPQEGKKRSRAGEPHPSSLHRAPLSLARGIQVGTPGVLSWARGEAGHEGDIP